MLKQYKKCSGCFQDYIILHRNVHIETNGTQLQNIKLKGAQAPLDLFSKILAPFENSVTFLEDST